MLWKIKQIMHYANYPLLFLEMFTDFEQIVLLLFRNKCLKQSIRQ